MNPRLFCCTGKALLNILKYLARLILISFSFYMQFIYYLRTFKKSTRFRTYIRLRSIRAIFNICQTELFISNL